MERPIPKMSQNSNMNELLKQKAQLDLNLPFCICCLIQNGPFISISLCVHADFLNTYPILKESTQLKKVVCEDCHLLMTKIYKFKLQIEETCNFLSNKIDYIDKIEQRKKKLSRSNIVYNDIPAINKNIESQEDENSNKIKNIETALTILNNNATSLESCDLKSMTEVLFQMTANTLNLESSKVLPDKKKNRNRDAMLPKFESMPNINMNVLPVDVKEKSEYIINELLKNTEEVANFDSVTKKLPVEKNETVTVAAMKRNSEISRSDSGPKTLTDDSNYDNIASTSTTSQEFLSIKLNKNQLLKEREEKMKSADFLRWPYRCEQCVIGFRYKENLEFHKRHHQKPIQEENSEETKTVSDNRSYNDFQLEECIALIRAKILPQGAAAAYYNIPRNVIKAKLYGKNKQKRKLPEFLDEEELLIANHIITLAKYGCNITVSDIGTVIQNYLESENKIVYRFMHNIPSKGWIRRFLKRHTSIYQHLNRTSSGNWKDAVVEFFKRFGKEIEGISPQNIYSFDGISFSDDLSKKPVVWKRGADVFDGFEPSFSVMFCGNAAGEYISPYIVHNSKYFSPTWTRKKPGVARYNITKSGYVEAPIFDDWFFNHVVQALQKKEGKKLLIGSDVASHITVKVGQKCINSNISFICLPAAAVEALNPLDIAYFRPLKVKWEEILIAGNSENYFKNPEVDFTEMLKSALSSVLIKENLTAAFRWTGLHPMDAQIPLVWFTTDHFVHDYSVSRMDSDSIISLTLSQLLEHNEKKYKINVGCKRKLAVSYGEERAISDAAQAESSKDHEETTHGIPKKILKFQDQ